MKTEEVGCRHISVSLCDRCPDIHISSFMDDGEISGSVLIPKDALNAVIVEMMKIRDLIKHED